MSRLTRFFEVTRKLRHGVIHFRQSLDVPSKRHDQSVTTANAKGLTSNLLIDIVAFLELFNVRLENITY